MPDPGAGPAGSSLPRAVRLRVLAGWLGWALVLILLDQATKVWVMGALGYGQRVPVLPVFDLTLLYNTGAAFSFLADGGGAQRWVFTGIAGVAALLILRWLYTHAAERLLCAALACILGGALGNAIDRLLHGHVVDFLLFYWRGWYFPAFNLADVAITCGAALLILDEILRARRARSS
ncbi:signal peptidase II [Castellaniella ginsengisoli]|uniref:Lipoprotein signal peptidase n=1 Tax=Castellaniella ginsengisoli TaxID=546114 RepID=A0AB39EPT5_9BURK